MVKSTFLFFSLLISIAAFGQTPAEKSKAIADAYRAFAAIAEGSSTFQVKPTKSVYAALKEIAESEQVEDFAADWVGESDQAWEADSTRWGSTTMKSAYGYIVGFDFIENRFAGSDNPQAELKKLMPKINKAKAAFKSLLGTGVMFGVGPLGAVQCGVRFASLLMIDPHTGKVYSIIMEGSGC